MRSLYTKILIWTILPVILLSIGLILFVKNTITKKFLEQLHENGIFIARHFADMSIPYVLTGDNSTLQTIANNYKNSHNDINYIFIQDSHGNILVHTFNQGVPLELKDANILGPDQTYSAKRLTMKKGVIIFNVASPISGKTEAEHTHGTHAELKSQKDTSHILERVGVVHIGFSEENIENYAAKITNLGIEIAIIVLILGVGGAVVFATVITKPVSELTKGVEAVGSGNLNYKVHVKTKDEVGKLSESFNEMVEKLRTAKEEIIKTNRELELEIIERKMAKQRLQIEKDRLQNFLDITTLMIAAIDSDQLVSLINKKGCEILGYSENEIVGKNWFDNFIPERNRDKVKTVFEKLITGEIKPSEYYENPVLTRSGEERIIAWHNSIIKDKEGNTIGTLSSGEDITYRDAAESALKESERKYRNLVDNALIGIYKTNLKGYFVYANEALAKMLEFESPEEIMREGVLRRYKNPKDREVLIENLKQNGRVEKFETEVLTKTGKVKHIILNATLDRDILSGMILDISERKYAEELLRQTRQDWEKTFDSITDMITVHDKDYNIIMANKSAQKLLNLPNLKEILNVKCYKYYHGTDGPPAGCPGSNCLQTGQPCNFELFEPNLNMFIEIKATPRLDDNNQVIGVIHIVSDITERKRLEEILLRGKQEWEMTFDNAAELIILLNKDLDIIRCNKSFAKFTQIPVQELIGRKITDFISTSPEHTEWRPLKERTEIRTEKGQWLHLSFYPIMDRKSRFLHSVLIGTDVTTLKNTEQKLIETINELEKREHILLKSKESFLNMLEDISESYKDLEYLFMGLVKAMVNALDAKSPWTRGHSDRVAQIAQEIAKEMNFDEDELKKLRLAGLLHDIGKIGTYDYLLDKPAKLTNEEFEIVKKHPVQGAEIIKEIKQLREIIPIIRHHHENFNGTGYPDRLRAEEIPFFASILHVADSFDSMTSDRPYRPSPGIEYAISELKKYSGVQFNPQVVNVFLNIIELNNREFLNKTAS